MGGSKGQMSVEVVLVLLFVVVMAFSFKNWFGYQKDQRSGGEMYRTPAEQPALKDCADRGECRREGNAVYMN